MLRFKVGLVAVLSCLAILVGMFSSVGVASAQGTPIRSSQGNPILVVNHPQARFPMRCQTFTIVNSRFRQFEDLDTHHFYRSETFFGGAPGVFVFVNGRRLFHHVRLVNFETVTIVTICNGHRSQIVKTIIV
jgi:hypothetical protein